jgi:thiopeptide-type bacteriocin biosynthesis protein
MSGTAGSDRLDPDLLATPGDDRWIEMRCALPLESARQQPCMPWQPLASAVRTWTEGGLCRDFFFVRKPPGVRLRFSVDASRERLVAAIDDWVAEMTRHRHVVSHVSAIYEPEEYRFGGPAGMAVAHRLWSDDSKLVLEYECLSPARRGSVSRAALWALSVNELLRGALDDTAEAWDVWCRLADAVSRWQGGAGSDPPPGYRAIAGALFEPSAHWLSLLRADVRSIVDRGRCLHGGVGEALKGLVAHGTLRTGRRAWLAANALFQANRWGLGLSPMDLGAVTLAMEQLLRPDRVTAVTARAVRSPDSSRTRGT